MNGGVAALRGDEKDGGGGGDQCSKRALATRSLVTPRS